VSDKRSGIEKAASTIVMAYVGFPSLSQHDRVMAMISDYVQPEMDELSQKIQRLERENAALREDNLKAHQMACAAGLERDRLRDELAALRKHLAEMRFMFHDMADRFGCPEFKTYLFDDFMRMKRELLARELLHETAYPARAKEGGAT
jgi:hypothetical protein